MIYLYWHRFFSDFFLLFILIPTLVNYFIIFIGKCGISNIIFECLRKPAIFQNMKKNKPKRGFNSEKADLMFSPRLATNKLLGI